jgi:hypothetical protein
MKDAEKVPLSVSADAIGPFTWESSDPAQVGVEPQGDGHTCYATTPLDAGEATVTVKAKGYETETIKVTYSDSTPGNLNLSAGVPESD